MLHIDPRLYLIAPLLLLVLPLDWLVSMILAAAIHEICHILMIRFFKMRILGITIGAGGAEIQTDLQNPIQELLCTLAGPVGSFSLLLLSRMMPKLALCGALQGLFNILPVYPLDGGRVLRCLARLIYPEQGEKIAGYWERGVLVVLTLTALILVPYLGMIPLFFLLILSAKTIMRKKPCKPDRFRVQ